MVLSAIVAIKRTDYFDIINILAEIVSTAHIALIVISRYRDDICAIYSLEKLASFLELTF